MAMIVSGRDYDVVMAALECAMDSEHCEEYGATREELSGLLAAFEGSE
jgi:hypothetical protein